MYVMLTKSKANKEYFKQKGKVNYQKKTKPKKRLHVPTQRLVITLSQRKKKVASRAYSRASYSSRPEKKKAASRAYSKASYDSEPEKKKAASRAYSD